MSIVEDTYAEAFKSLYSEVLITARDHKWLEYAVNAATGNASSTIMCDCEAGVDRFVGPGGDGSLDTPDGRPVQSFNFTSRGFVRIEFGPWKRRC